MGVLFLGGNVFAYYNKVTDPMFKNLEVSSLNISKISHDSNNYIFNLELNLKAFNEVPIYIFTVYIPESKKDAISKYELDPAASEFLYNKSSLIGVFDDSSPSQYGVKGKEKEIIYKKRLDFDDQKNNFLVNFSNFFKCGTSDIKITEEFETAVDFNFYLPSSLVKDKILTEDDLKKGTFYVYGVQYLGISEGKLMEKDYANLVEGVFKTKDQLNSVYENSNSQDIMDWKFLMYKYYLEEGEIYGHNNRFWITHTSIDYSTLHSSYNKSDIYFAIEDFGKKGDHSVGNSRCESLSYIDYAGMIYVLKDHMFLEENRQSFKFIKDTDFYSIENITPNGDDDSDGNDDSDGSQNTIQQTSKNFIQLNAKNPFGENYLCENNICYVLKDKVKSLDFEISNYDRSLKDSSIIANMGYLKNDFDQSKINQNILASAVFAQTNTNNEFNLIDSAYYKINYPSFKNTSEYNFKLNNIQFSTAGNDSYYISVAQKNNNNLVNNYASTYFIVGVDNQTLSKLLLYKINGKILDLFCEDCLPDWLPVNIQLSSINGNSSFFPILDEFKIFNLDDKTKVDNIPISSGIASDIRDIKETFRKELEKRYNAISKSNIKTTKLFMQEINNFNLSDNEIAMFYSVIGAESWFTPNAVGDQENSFGFVQLYASSWKTDIAYKQLKVYLDEYDISEKTYFDYFEKTKLSAMDQNDVLYIGLAAFKYELDKVKNYMKSTNNDKTYDDYTDIEKAFILFYEHQMSSDNAGSFFNNYDPKKLAINDCVNKPNSQSTPENRLNCVASIGSVRKMAWYLYFYESTNKNYSYSNAQ
jgi:hypothetical protein